MINGRARYSAGLVPLRPALPPIRPDICADGSAFGADHLRPERRHRQIARPVIGADDRFVVALVAVDRERPHAIGAHVAEVHRLDRIVETPGRHKQKNPALGGDKF
jgi:hypothetical protein